MCLGIPGRIVEIIDAGEALAMVEVGDVRLAGEHRLHHCR